MIRRAGTIQEHRNVDAWRSDRRSTRWRLGWTFGPTATPNIDANQECGMEQTTEIWRYRAGSPPSSVRDQVAMEEPLEIRVKNRAISITMRTPGHDEELAAGFLLTEGVIRDRADIVRI